MSFAHPRGVSRVLCSRRRAERTSSTSSAWPICVDGVLRAVAPKFGRVARRACGKFLSECSNHCEWFWHVGLVTSERDAFLTHVLESVFALPGFLMTRFTWIWGCDQRSLGWACCACPGTTIDRHDSMTASPAGQVKMVYFQLRIGVWKCQVKRHRQEQKFVAKDQRQTEFGLEWPIHTDSCRLVLYRTCMNILSIYQISMFHKHLLISSVLPSVRLCLGVW